MKLQFNHSTITTVWLEVWETPALTRRSKTNPMFNTHPLSGAMRNRQASFLAELLMNIAIGNGAQFGAISTVDVPPDIEVKWSAKAHKLIASPKELKPGYKFVLATGFPEIEILGWAYAEEITRPMPNHPRNARYIGRDKLHAIESLLKKYAIK